VSSCPMRARRLLEDGGDDLQQRRKLPIVNDS
jgi:hypothetical protein